MAEALLFALLACTSAQDSASPTGPTDSAADSGTDTATGARTSAWTFDSDTVIVTVEDPDSPARTYTFSTTHPQRDGAPSERTLSEDPEGPVLRTGNDLLDGLFALALDEVSQASVATVSDGSFAGGTPQDCDCFETGALWPWVWTRDTSYAAHLGLAWVDPERARDSLDFKLSERKSSLGGGLLQVVQDTGSGGSWPVSTDRVGWALGAARTLAFLDDDARELWLPRVREALANTLELHRQVAWDPTDGLYRGEQSFLDWREQSYPSWTAGDVVPIASSKALSTNLLHLEALALTATLTEALGEDATAWWTQHAELEQALDTFWSAGSGTWHSLLGPPLDPSLWAQQDALGIALAAVALDEAQAAEALENLPFTAAGPPVIWPQQPFTPIYHNRAVWPFVTATVGRAAHRVRNPEVAVLVFDSLVRGAALNLSNMENLEFLTGANHVDDGEWSGPVVNSRRQLWSVAGFLSVVVDGLFGVRADLEGLRTDPFVPAELRERWLSDRVVLHRFPYRGEQLDLELDLSASDGSGTARVVVDEGDPDTFFAPLEATLTGPTSSSGPLSLELGDGGESGVSLQVYRDGVRVAEDLAPGTWVDPDIDPSEDRTVCYAIAAAHSSTGLVSQHTPASCWWGPSYERVGAVEATEFVATGGTLVNNHGRWHYQDWGGPEHVLEIPLTVDTGGPHWLQAVYGNGSGPISTGVTCGLKWLEVLDPSGAVVAEGPLVMPHRGSWEDWGDSTVVAAALESDVSYTVRLRDQENMSSLEHHALYDGAGGGSEAHNDVNITQLKVLRRAGG